MDQDIVSRLDNIEKKADGIYSSVEKTRKYFMWTLIITVIFLVLPLIGLAIVLPMLMSQLNSIYGAYGGLY